jgi:hypothetical protein
MKAVHEMTHFIQSKAARLRQPQYGKAMNSGIRISPLSTGTCSHGQHPDFLPIANSGGGNASFQSELSNGHQASLDLKLTSSLIVKL